MNIVATATDTLDVIGVFPAWDPGPIGGIQRSGKEAWEAVLSKTGSDAAHAICYAPGSSKAATVLRALRMSAPARTILVWHLDLLKLLPFLDSRDSRIVLFLNGIEAWKPQDVVTQWLMKRVHLFVTNTEHTWREFLRANPEFSTCAHQTVHLGLDEPSRETVRPADVPAAVMVSRLDASQSYKGHWQTIAAWPAVTASVPEAKLWIVGGGDLKPALEQRVRESNLTDSVRFFGQVSNDSRDDLIRRARCFAMPSRGDGFGLVYLEAMRAGRPCLVSTLDAGREVVNPPEAGLAVDPERSDEVAAALIRLLSSGDEWNRWSAQAKHRYDTQFTAAHFRRRLQATLFD